MKRTLTLGAAWTASAAAAIGLGFLAVSLVDASASPGSVPAGSSAELTSTGAASSSTSAPAASTSSGSDGTTGPGVPGATVSVEQVTAGGTVYAGCQDGRPVLASAPAAGWWVDDSSTEAEVEFNDGGQSIEVHVGCAGGSPKFSVEGPRADDRDRDDSSSTPPAATSSSTHPTGDDSDARVGGGHGSDDGAGDDSDDRRGGGHGSDD
jgi:hypothetical protein